MDRFPPFKTLLKVVFYYWNDFRRPTDSYPEKHPSDLSSPLQRNPVLCPNLLSSGIADVIGRMGST